VGTALPGRLWSRQFPHGEDIIGIRWSGLDVSPRGAARSAAECVNQVTFASTFVVRDHVVQSALGVKAKLDGIQFEASALGRSSTGLHHGGD
jgi:hypothetical protein